MSTHIASCKLSQFDVNNSQHHPVHAYKAMHRQASKVEVATILLSIHSGKYWQYKKEYLITFPRLELCNSKLKAIHPDFTKRVL